MVSTTMWRFLPLMFFAAVNSTIFAGTNGFDALRIYNRITGSQRAIFNLSCYFNKRLKYLIPEATYFCPTKKAVNRLSWWKIIGKLMPFVPIIDLVKNSVYQFPFCPLPIAHTLKK